MIITLPAIGCHFPSLLTTVDVSHTQAIFGMMSSSPKRATYTAEEVLYTVLQIQNESNIDSDCGGMSRKEESARNRPAAAEF